MDTPPLNWHDLLHIGVYLVGVAITLAVLKTEIRWIKAWMAEHKRDDEAAFTEIRRDIRELRHSEREDGR